MAQELQRDAMNTGRTGTDETTEGINKPVGSSLAEREDQREDETMGSRYADTDAAALRPGSNPDDEEGDEDYDDEEDDTDDLIGDDADDIDDADDADLADIDDEDFDEENLVLDDEDEEEDV